MKTNKKKYCPKCGRFLKEDTKEHICKNSMLGKKHSKATKKKIGKKSVNRNWATGQRNGSYKDGLIKIRGRIRFLTEYNQWRQAVIDNSETKYIKGMQVHHLKPFNLIIEENNIKNVEDARNCKELWDVDNGCVLKKGEHYILSQLGRMKYHSTGFIKLIKIWISKAEDLE